MTAPAHPHVPRRGVSWVSLTARQGEDRPAEVNR